ncbi:MAG: peptidase M56, BlaR1 [Chitinophagaceae bacterium]|nr:MAG: peptidase M56, BlaR1 [Chitinophagaceae bacterium]
MIPYILHVALLVAGCLAFYKVFLQRETFFRLNRWVLLACLLLAFALPLARVPAQWSLRKAAPAETAAPAAAPLLPNAVDNLAGGEGKLANPQAPAPSEAAPASVPVAAKAESTPIDAGRVLQWVGWLYWFGVVAFAFNFLLQMGLLLFRAYTNPVIRDGRYRIVELAGDVAPCSFGNNIFINPEKYDWDTYQQVLEHEKVHCSGRHSVDILLAEIVLIFQWFNPFAWMYRKTLESNLEFLTDEELLERRSFDPSSYQMSLLRVSAPHLPLGLTTNYNQSLLKKRILMMQAKKSNWHTSWKYFFLLPLMAFFMCLLNEPAAQAQGIAEQRKERRNTGVGTEGYWFATIKGDKVQFNFQNNDDPNNRNMNGNAFPLSELPALPRNGQGNFSLKRDAGTMEFTGRFEGEQGMGRYKFTADPSFADFLKEQGIAPGTEEDRMVLFMVNASRAYVGSLKAEGYTAINRNDLVPLAALNVNAEYIRSLKAAGLTRVSLHDLIPLRSLGVDKAYIDDIRKVYPNVDAGRLITLKAQGIDSKYVEAVRSSKAATAPKRVARDTGYRVRPDDGRGNDDKEDEDEAATRARVREERRGERLRERVVESNVSTNKVVNSNTGPGKTEYNDRDVDEMVSMKSLHVTEAYIQSIREAGFPDISNRQVISFKALGVTPAYIQGLREMGFSNLRANDVSGAKSVGVTAEFVRSFEPVGFKALRLDDYTSFKALGITAGLVKQYQDLGFKVRPHDVTGARATGTTPAFIASMQEKGYKLSSLDKYVSLKAVVQ